MDNMRSDGSIKLPDHSLPSDYSDVHPDTYDPEYISQISSRMQVPHRIGIGSDNRQGPDLMNGIHDGGSSGSRYAGMSIPDKIILAGDNQHIGMRPEMLDYGPSRQMSSDSLSYVGLMTPPRVLTLEETFPAVNEMEEPRDKSANAAEINFMGNGHLNGPVAYVPGSINESVLLNEEDETTLLRTQVAKLTRRMQVIELENQKRVQRELIAYPVILGYFLWKVLGWLTRDR